MNNNNKITDSYRDDSWGVQQKRQLHENVTVFFL